MDFFFMDSPTPKTENRAETKITNPTGWKWGVLPVSPRPALLPTLVNRDMILIKGKSSLVRSTVSTYLEFNILKVSLTPKYYRIKRVVR